jgi:hypothetical protein
MATFDPAENFCFSTVAAHDNVATEITIESSDINADLWPDPAVDGAYNVVCWNSTTYPNAALDPYREIYRATALSGYVLTCTRAQEGTVASVKNLAACVYRIALVPTAKFRDDLELAAVDTGSNFGWLTDYGATGDGAADDRTALASAVAALTHVVIPYGTYRLSSDITIPNTVALEFHQGANFSVDSGKTLTINGEVVAGNWQIFSGSGTVTLSNRSAERFKRWNGTDIDSVMLGGKCHYFGAAAPTTGTWAVGDIVYHTDAAAGETPAWYCTTAGTPGTWTAFAVLGTAATSTAVESASIDVVSSTGEKSCVIAHGLAYTPDPKNIVLSSYRDAGTGTTAGMRGPYILSTDATNITVSLNLTATTTSTGTTIKIVARVMP